MLINHKNVSLATISLLFIIISLPCGQKRMIEKSAIILKKKSLFFLIKTNRVNHCTSVRYKYTTEIICIL